MMHRPLPARPAHLLSSAFLLTLATAVSFDCRNVVADEHAFDFSPLGGHRSVSHVTESTPNILNTTYTLDICSKLGRDRNIDNDKQCPEGTWICGITNLVRDDHTDLQHVLPIARQYEHERASLDPKLQILPDSRSNADSEKEGVRVIMGGGKDTHDGKKVPQQAVIEFLCQEGTDTPSRGVNLVRDNTRAEEDDDDGKPNPEWEKLKTTEDGHGGTLTFISYTNEEEQGTLHLEWKTKYACRDYDGSDGDGGSSSSGGGWGFFSWIFLLGFMGLLGYFGFFAWINYNKYGATGWDLVPHADTIRDMPYVLSDWGHKVIGSVTGGPSRGGYSAV